MAVSTPSIVTPKLHTLQTFNPKPQITFKANSNSCFSRSLCSSRNSIPSSSSSRRKIFDLGVGLLAASVVASSPFDASATRIEYYATVAEPSCELNFARSGLGYCDVAVGFGEEAPLGELINVHYTARFADGIVFDSSYKRARPLTMRIGVGKVIKGLDQGILGGEGVPPMLVGGRRKLQIPPELAYGPEPAGCFSGDCNIPANATLVYDINFINIYSGNRK
ncbi:photosynthetic NDH subunit of lumenal location 4, chloroplastic [Cornus florida]|uniref:photosynthetic NDH subunit of lumenal location 4, chloroplastic n=1 Tax=Cornus florida TaxID=4283 RepID=UPI002899DF90|nr:photosynthetic NDH subunit of lumenal location 4, chloroplastic [Cornus florida]XP_059624318.1 photosynthetic NDH subunit of lumenal location 4, chloroplastic [Cornus florida]XP_059624319.1 photosynthetic NDH subunit of lumenal location 4, chloroplastic [Cornus florida]XP_059624320.1 photosynthetic NDH subunit of lumenal location 4, chloroplastic [Cornus florida]